jgi:hypothetical protein
LSKPYGIELSFYWERLEEQLGNLWNPLGTHWEQVFKKSLSPRKENNWTPHVKLSHWLHELLFSKLFVTIFGLG